MGVWFKSPKSMVTFKTGVSEFTRFKVACPTCVCRYQADKAYDHPPSLNEVQPFANAINCLCCIDDRDRSDVTV
jgi:hypothetical protein